MKYRLRKTRLLAFVMVMMVACDGSPGTPEQRAKDIASGLRCPVCQGLSVEESKIGISVDMKEKIEEMIAAGKTDEEVYLYFEERYGEWIRRVPKRSGFNLLLWILPAIFMTLGILTVVTVIRSNR